MDTWKYAYKYLFSEIGIDPISWNRDPQGYYCGGSGLVLTAQDMAKFGYLYLQNGVWDGNQIIPEEWIAESTKKQIATTTDDDYGYLFWLKNMTDTEHNKDYFTYCAAGVGGQYIVIIPELDMVVVITANIQVDSKDKSTTLDLIPNYILPAVKYS
jgi:CubicO group peptidase (beta-lactamase class C family)